MTFSVSHGLLSTQMLWGEDPPASPHPQNAFPKQDQLQLSPCAVTQHLFENIQALQGCCCMNIKELRQAFDVQHHLPDPSQLLFHLWCQQSPRKPSQLSREVPTPNSSQSSQGKMGLSFWSPKLASRIAAHPTRTTSPSKLGSGTHFLSSPVVPLTQPGLLLA